MPWLLLMVRLVACLALEAAARRARLEGASAGELQVQGRGRRTEFPEPRALMWPSASPFHTGAPVAFPRAPQHRPVHRIHGDDTGPFATVSSFRIPGWGGDDEDPTTQKWSGWGGQDKNPPSRGRESDDPASRRGDDAQPPSRKWSGWGGSDEDPVPDSDIGCQQSFSLELDEVTPVRVVVPHGGKEAALEWAKVFEQPLHLLQRACGVFLVTETFMNAATCPLALQVVDEQTTRSRNEVEIMNRLRSSGDVVALFGSCEVLGKTCLVVEATNGTLAGMLQDSLKETDSRRLHLNKSLPILIDVLRAMVDLEREGIVHTSLNEESILMKDGRPLLGNFGDARLIDDADVGFGRMAPTVEPSLRHAPETFNGNPTGASNNVWAVGLLFGRMTLGYQVTKEALRSRIPSLKRFMSMEGSEEAIYRIIREDFLIELDPGFNDLHPSVRELLSGMLEKDPALRWTAKEALMMASRTALQLGLRLPRTRTPKLPPRWWKVPDPTEPQRISGPTSTPAEPSELLASAWQ